jgi:hypothetical protein
VVVIQDFELLDFDGSSHFQILLDCFFESVLMNLLITRTMTRSSWNKLSTRACSLAVNSMMAPVYMAK